MPRQTRVLYIQPELPLDLKELSYPHPQVPKYDNGLYHSYAEHKISIYLQKHVSGWRPIPGKTIQIDISNRKFVDFRVRDTLVEFHPVIVNRELRSTFAMTKLAELGKSLDKTERALLKEALEAELFSQYEKKRRLALEACKTKEIRECRLIVCKDEMEFYRAVLVPFGNRGLIPKAHEFMQDWKKWY
jgi:hypothetical protein